MSTNGSREKRENLINVKNHILHYRHVKQSLYTLPPQRAAYQDNQGNNIIQKEPGKPGNWKAVNKNISLGKIILHKTLKSLKHLIRHKAKTDDNLR